MVALTFIVSFIFITYVVIPAGLFRFIAGTALPLRKFHKNRVEEISFAIVVCSIPYILALFLTWQVALFNDLPWSVKNWEKRQSRRQAYKTFLAGSLKRDLADDDAFWAALTQVGRRQARFLAWYWLLVSLEAGGYILLVRTRAYQKLGFLQLPLLKGLSDWYIFYPYLHTGPENKPVVLLDVRTGETDLVKGRLWDFFLSTEGELSGLLLWDPVRRKRSSEQGENDSVPWRYIPSRVLYVPFSSITDMNVRYVTEEEFKEIPAVKQAMETYLCGVLRRLHVQDAVVKIS